LLHPPALRLLLLLPSALPRMSRGDGPSGLAPWPAAPGSKQPERDIGIHHSMPVGWAAPPRCTAPTGLDLSAATSSASSSASEFGASGRTAWPVSGLQLDTRVRGAEARSGRRGWGEMINFGNTTVARRKAEGLCTSAMNPA
jgi:hypothetical protein